MSKKVHLPVVQRAMDLVPLEPLSLPSDPYLPETAPTVDFSQIDLSSRAALRTSSYTIYVDLPGNDDEMLLVHAYTGAYDRVSRRVATYLRSLEASHAPKPLYGDWTPEPRLEGQVLAPEPETIAVLKKRGYLVALTPEEEEALFIKLASRHHHKEVHQPPAYVLMLTYGCNLRCGYCFQDHMRTDPAYSHLLRSTDRAMADRIMAGMDQIDAQHGIRADSPTPRSITLFGGEPLLAENRPVVEYMIRRIQEQRKTQISAITNATELDAYFDLLGPAGISMLQITLDGPPEEHDKRRIYADGSGSFERIAANLTRALDLGVRVHVRMNIDRGNIGMLPALADEFQARGWTGRGNFYPYVAPITAHNDVSSKTTFTTWQLGRAIDELKAEHPQMAPVGLFDDTLRHQARLIFDGNSAAMPKYRTSFCGAHSSMYVIDPFGDIYACWEVTGDPEVRIGHIKQDGSVFMNRAIIERWRARSVVSNPVCRKCRYATSCGGGCAVLAEEASGDAYTNHCDGYAKRFRAAVAEAYVSHAAGATVGDAVARLCDA
jgi:uncharacterized protein